MPGYPISPAVNDHVRVSANGDRTGGRRSRGRESEDGARDERADGCRRDNGGREDVSPNAHDCLHAFTEVTA